MPTGKSAIQQIGNLRYNAVEEFWGADTLMLRGYCPAAVFAWGLIMSNAERAANVVNR